MSQQHMTGSFNKGFETFGQHLFLKRLAAGGMAEVFLSRPVSHVGNGRVQVVKRILPHVANNSMFRNMFQSEIQVIMGFNHPQIVQLHDFGEINGQPYISMEYIEGKNLKELISKCTERKEYIPVPMVLSLAIQGASGLSYAHTFVNKVTGDTVNAIHRDISPHNLILSYEGNLKVIDFGIAKAASGMQEPTRAGTIKGKIAYLSPEQINGQNIDARSDIFALGIVVWEMLTLRRPFHKAGDSDGAIISRIDNCDQHLMPPSLINAEVPKEVDEVVMKAMKRNPDERYATASDFQMALRQVMMKFFPDYTYADTGKKIRSLFAEEIESERKELRELNLVAQKVVSSHLEASTRVIDSHNQTITATYPGQVGGVTGVMDNLKTIVPGAVNQVDDRLLKIEQLMKQKASGRHYLMLAFYVVSLIALKLDDKYSVFNLLFPQQQVVEERLDEASTDMRPAKSKGQSKKKKGSKSSSSVQGQGIKPKQAQAGLGENM